MMNKMMQVKYCCGHCDWFVLTDMYAKNKEEADKLPGYMGEKWEKARRQHYEDAHPKEWATHRLKRILRGAL